MDIQRIVIDANNLCYEGRTFLKLAALEALVPILARKYKVTLIFDAGIRRKLGLSSEDLETRFSTAERVHIVASRRKADETVLRRLGMIHTLSCLAMIGTLITLKSRPSRRESAAARDSRPICIHPRPAG